MRIAFMYLILLFRCAVGAGLTLHKLLVFSFCEQDDEAVHTCLLSSLVVLCLPVAYWHPCPPRLYIVSPF
jgi:hypothetical protein